MSMIVIIVSMPKIINYHSHAIAHYHWLRIQKTHQNVILNLDSILYRSLFVVSERWFRLSSEISSCISSRQEFIKTTLIGYSPYVQCDSI